MDYREEIITVRFDSEMLKGFTGYDVNNPEAYFKAHPRAKKPPQDGLHKKKRTGLIPSINTFLNCNDRVLQNEMEQHLKRYCEYCMNKQGIKHDFITECVILVVQFKPSRTKSDVNNVYTKPFIDAMVERELIKEDNYTVVRLHMEFAVVDKTDPHSEIRIYPITDEFDFMCATTTMMNDIIELEDKYKN